MAFHCVCFKVKVRDLLIPFEEFFGVLSAESVDPVLYQPIRMAVASRQIVRCPERFDLAWQFAEHGVEKTLFTRPEHSLASLDSVVHNFRMTLHRLVVDLESGYQQNGFDSRLRLLSQKRLTSSPGSVTVTERS